LAGLGGNWFFCRFSPTMVKVPFFKKRPFFLRRWKSCILAHPRFQCSNKYFYYFTYSRKMLLIVWNYDLFVVRVCYYMKTPQLWPNITIFRSSFPSLPHGHQRRERTNECLDQRRRLSLEKYEEVLCRWLRICQILHFKTFLQNTGHIKKRTFHFFKK